MTLPVEKGRSIRSALTIIVFLTFVGTTYEFMDTGRVTVWGPVIGFLLGLMLGVFEEFIFAHRLRELPFIATILIKTCSYVGIIMLIFMSTGLVAGIIQGLTMDDFLEEITSRDFWGKIVVTFAVFLAVVFFIERTRLEAENQLKRLELQKARELEQAYEALEESHRDLKTAQTQLIHTEKMASLGQLTAGIAHEIKNPLNFVNNFAALSRELVDELEEETDPEEIKAILADLKTNAKKIEEHGRQADGIVRSMLEHSRGGSSERRAIDLNTLVANHVDLVWHGKRGQATGFNVEITKDLGAAIGQVEVVPQEIGRVLLNLIDNAFDAVHERAAQVNGQYAPMITVTTRRVDGQIEIRVADNGLGISEDMGAKIFEPFFTTKPTGTGTGLGLSLSYDIVTQGHGGTLTVESEEGKGATFIVTLPMNKTEAASNA